MSLKMNMKKTKVNNYILEHEIKLMIKSKICVHEYIGEMR